jgi:hypothetical protein
VTPRPQLAWGHSWQPSRPAARSASTSAGSLLTMSTTMPPGIPEDPLALCQEKGEGVLAFPQPPHAVAALNDNATTAATSARHQPDRRPNPSTSPASVSLNTWRQSQTRVRAPSKERAQPDHTRFSSVPLRLTAEGHGISNRGIHPRRSSTPSSTLASRCGSPVTSSRPPRPRWSGIASRPVRSRCVTSPPATPWPTAGSPVWSPRANACWPWPGWTSPAFRWW